MVNRSCPQKTNAKPTPAIKLAIIIRILGKISYPYKFIACEKIIIGGEISPCIKTDSRAGRVVVPKSDMGFGD
jgi:hypothetical protein